MMHHTLTLFDGILALVVPNDYISEPSQVCCECSLLNCSLHLELHMHVSPSSCALHYYTSFITIQFAQADGTDDGRAYNRGIFLMKGHEW
jgi:hypothetical protein